MIGIFQCQEVSHLARYCPHIWCYDCDNYGHVANGTVQIKYSHQVHQPTAELTPMTEVGGLPLDVTATPDTHTMNTGTDLDSVALNLNPVTTAIGVVATMTLIEVTPGHSTDLPIATCHMIGAPVPTTAVVIHPTTDPLSHRNTS